MILNLGWFSKKRSTRGTRGWVSTKQVDRLGSGEGRGGKFDQWLRALWENLFKENSAPTNNLLAETIFNILSELKISSNEISGS